jgi:hypothetical protein
MPNTGYQVSPIQPAMAELKPKPHWKQKGDRSAHYSQNQGKKKKNCIVDAHRNPHPPMLSFHHPF